MGSMYASIKKANNSVTHRVQTLADFEETDPYWFMVMESGKILAEGSLPDVKYRLDAEYITKPIKSFSRDSVLMMTTIKF